MILDKTVLKPASAQTKPAVRSRYKISFSAERKTK